MIKKLQFLSLNCALISYLYGLQEGDLQTVSSKNNIPFCLGEIKKYLIGHIDDAQRNPAHVFHVIPLYHYKKTESLEKSPWELFEDNCIGNNTNLFKRRSTKPKKWLYLTTNDIFCRFLIEDKPIGALILNIEEFKELHKVHQFLLISEVFSEQRKKHNATRSESCYYPQKNKRGRRHSIHELLFSKLKLE